MEFTSVFLEPCTVAGPSQSPRALVALNRTARKLLPFQFSSNPFSLVKAESSLFLDDMILTPLFAFLPL